MITGPRRSFELRCKQRGYSLGEVQPCIVSEEGDMVTVDETHKFYPHARKPPSESQHGPGTELKALLKDWLGIEASPTCSCNTMARKMNALGPEWSESDEGMAEILGVMRAEHGKRWKAGQTILPWTDLGARQLVLLACRRARANG
jgi:hypothetical protein